MDEWHKRQIRAINTLCQDHWHFADVGACRGDLFGYLVQLMSDAHAFEPHPINNKSLRRKFSGPTVEINQSAVGNRDGFTTLYTGKNFYTGSTNKDALECSATSSFEVPVIKLDTYFEGRHVDFIKLDVEGDEWDVFEGAIDLLMERDILWQVEFHNNEDWHKRKMLYDLDYNIFDLDFIKIHRDCTRPYQAFVSRRNSLI